MSVYVCWYIHWRVTSDSQTQKLHQPLSQTWGAAGLSRGYADVTGCKIWILITATSRQLPASDPNEGLSALGTGAHI